MIRIRIRIRIGIRIRIRIRIWARFRARVGARVRARVRFRIPPSFKGSPNLINLSPSLHHCRLMHHPDQGTRHVRLRLTRLPQRRISLQ